MNEELKEKLQDTANKWKIPIILKENISISKDRVILPLSNGNELHIYVEITPLLVSDNKIKVNYDLKMNEQNFQEEKIVSPGHVF